jgi:hypothetical protein
MVGNIVRVYIEAALLFSPLFVYSDQEPLSKKEQWEQMEEKVMSWRDGLGLPVDDGIKDAVMALNVLGITTSASCGGHLDRALAFPWIEIHLETPEILKLQEESRLVLEKRQGESDLLEKNTPHLSWAERWDLPEVQKLLDVSEECRKCSFALQQARQKHLTPLQRLLEQFYQSHFTSYDRMLVLSNDGIGKLNSLGGEWQDSRSAEERKSKLREYRAEMKAFTAFLKEWFFQEKSTIE